MNPVIIKWIKIFGYVHSLMCVIIFTYITALAFFSENNIIWLNYNHYGEYHTKLIYMSLLLLPAVYTLMNSIISEIKNIKNDE